MPLPVLLAHADAKDHRQPLLLGVSINNRTKLGRGCACQTSCSCVHAYIEPAKRKGVFRQKLDAYRVPARASAGSLNLAALGTYQRERCTEKVGNLNWVQITFEKPEERARFVHVFWELQRIHCVRLANISRFNSDVRNQSSSKMKHIRKPTLERPLLGSNAPQSTDDYSLNAERVAEPHHNQVTAEIPEELSEDVSMLRLPPYSARSTSPIHTQSSEDEKTARSSSSVPLEENQEHSLEDSKPGTGLSPEPSSDLLDILPRSTPFNVRPEAFVPSPDLEHDVHKSSVSSEAQEDKLRLEGHESSLEDLFPSNEDPFPDQSPMHTECPEQHVSCIEWYYIWPSITDRLKILVETLANQPILWGPFNEPCRTLNKELRRPAGNVYVELLCSQENHEAPFAFHLFSLSSPSIY